MEKGRRTEKGRRDGERDGGMKKEGGGMEGWRETEEGWREREEGWREREEGLKCCTVHSGI